MKASAFQDIEMLSALTEYEVNPLGLSSPPLRPAGRRIGRGNPKGRHELRRQLRPRWRQRHARCGRWDRKRAVGRERLGPQSLPIAGCTEVKYYPSTWRSERGANEMGFQRCWRFDVARPGQENPREVPSRSTVPTSCPEG